MANRGRPRTADHNDNGGYVALDKDGKLKVGRSNHMTRRDQEHQRDGAKIIAKYPGKNHPSDERELHRFYKNQQNDGEDFEVYM